MNESLQSNQSECSSTDSMEIISGLCLEDNPRFVKTPPELSHRNRWHENFEMLTDVLQIWDQTAPTSAGWLDVWDQQREKVLLAPP